MKNRALSTSRTHTSSIFRIFCKSFQHIEIGALSTHTNITQYTVSPFFGPFWTKNGQTWQACQRSKVVQRGPKGTKMVNLSLFEHLGPFWAHLDPFGPFQTRIDILLRSTSAKPYFVHLGQKNHFCLKWSKRVQMDPNGVPNDQKDLG